MSFACLLSTTLSCDSPCRESEPAPPLLDNPTHTLSFNLGFTSQGSFLCLLCPSGLPEPPPSPPPLPSHHALSFSISWSLWMLFWYNLFLHNSELINSSSFPMLSNQVLHLSTELLISTIIFFACGSCVCFIGKSAPHCSPSLVSLCFLEHITGLGFNAFLFPLFSFHPFFCHRFLTVSCFFYSMISFTGNGALFLPWGVSLSPGV